MGTPWRATWTESMGLGRWPDRGLKSEALEYNSLASAGIHKTLHNLLLVAQSVWCQDKDLGSLKFVSSLT